MRLGQQPVAPPWALQAMTMDDVDDVLAVEQRAYAFPWSRGNFVDSLATHDWAVVVRDPLGPWGDRGDRGQRGRVQGYLVAMHGVEEMHLLNVTVAPEVRRQGLATWLIQALLDACRAQNAKTMWLEVRPSNLEAQALYARWGFEARGVRKGYYPDARGAREDAIVMSMAVPSTKDNHAAQ